MNFSNLIRNLQYVKFLQRQDWKSQEQYNHCGSLYIISWYMMYHINVLWYVSCGSWWYSPLHCVVVHRGLTSDIRPVTASGSRLPFLDTTQNRCRDLHFLADRQNSWSMDKYACSNLWIQQSFTMNKIVTLYIEYFTIIINSCWFYRCHSLLHVQAKWLTKTKVWQYDTLHIPKTVCHTKLLSDGFVCCL